MRTVNVGVIGVGAMGYNHARVYYKLEEANLVAVSDVSERTLNKVAKKYDAKVFPAHDWGFFQTMKLAPKYYE